MNCETPHAAVWFDTETRPETVDKDTVVHRLWFGWAAARRTRAAGEWTAPEWCRFEAASALWDFVEDKARPKTRLYVFCHNTNFDLPVVDVFGSLLARGWKLAAAVIDGPPTILRFSKPGRTIMVLDTLNLWRMPLKQLGAMIGTAKLDMPVPEAPSALWDEYARQDVSVIMDACLRWWTFLVERDLGGFASTLAGQAFRAWRHRFMPAPVLADDNALALRLARDAYLGGRCECFRLGTIEKRLHTVDVNSMYPAMMAKRLYPARLWDATDTHGARALARYGAEFCAVAAVTIETDTPCYPRVVGGRLCFPVGRFRATLAGPELQRAIVSGHIAEVGAVALYHPVALFDGFVREMYSARLESAASGNASEAWLYKLLMNSLYGKFGQRGLIWEEQAWTDDLTARAWVEIDYATRKVTRMRQLAGLLQALSGEAEGRDSCPAIAAYVTSYARLHLWKLIEAAGRDHCFYCDTDSLLVDDVGLARLAPYMHATELGALKLEGTYPTATLYGPKDYRLGDKAKTKGVRKNAVWIDGSTVSQEKWSSLRGMLRVGDMARASTRLVTKRLKRVYAKGEVSRSGRVKPFTLSE